MSRRTSRNAVGCSGAGRRPSTAVLPRIGRTFAGYHPHRTEPRGASTKGERRAKRQLAAAGLGGEELPPAELAHRRQHVALELSNSNLDAQYLAGR